MAPKKIAKEYFAWLYDKVAGNPSYVNLSAYLHDRWEFYWSVEMDVNRQIDGYDLREVFLREAPGSGFTNSDRNYLMNEPVSVFEVLVALCDRMDFNLDDLVSGPRHHIWYAELLENLDLSKYTDEQFPGNDRSLRDVDTTIRILLDRSYDYTGIGSLFPLQEDHGIDMQQTEIWYQMMAYLDERE